MPEPLLSVVIPVGPCEDEIPLGLLQDLEALPEGSEVIFVGCDPAQSLFLKKLPVTYTQLYSVPGRAAQMNSGAAQANGKFLWFLHIDSRFQPELIQQLIKNLKQYPQRFHYNLLEFVVEGQAPMKLNAYGANLRSKLLGVPFGDQGFALSRSLFKEIGPYPVNVSYGEDHLLVWFARQHGVKLHCNEHMLKTSARKYQLKGWWRLTCKYQYLWLRQAWPEFLKLIKRRYFSPRCQR
ncbi:MAG: glycosyltransferase [Neptuniibacter sp.]